MAAGKANTVGGRKPSRAGTAEQAGEGEHRFLAMHMDHNVAEGPDYSVAVGRVGQVASPPERTFPQSCAELLTEYSKQSLGLPPAGSQADV